MSEAPSYTLEPGLGERRLAIALSDAHAPLTTFGTFVQRDRGIDVALYNQPVNARGATYGRSASVAGEVTLSSTHGVTSVEVTVSNP